jgi:hypothetical protein
MCDTDIRDINPDVPYILYRVDFPDYPAWAPLFFDSVEELSNLRETINPIHHVITEYHQTPRG